MVEIDPARDLSLEPEAGAFSILVDPLATTKPDGDEGPPVLSVELDLRKAMAAGAGKGKVVAGKLTLLGLAELREELGFNWPGILSRIHTLVEEEISSALQAGESFQLADEDVFIVQFDGLGKDAAGARARLIGSRVTDRLTRELPSVLETVSIDTFVAEVDLSLLSDAPDGLVPGLIGVLNKIRDEAHLLAQKLKKVAFGQIRLRYLPTLNQAQSRAEFSRCMLDPQSESAAALYFRQLGDENLLLSDLGELDAIILTKAVEAVHKTALTQQPAAIHVPVRITTLARRELRNEYLKHVRAIARPYRRAIVLDVVSGSVPLESAGCSAGLDQIGSYFRYTLRTRGDDLEQVGKRSGVWALSIDMLEAGDRSGGMATQKLSSVAKFASERGWSSIACGANSLGLVQLAIDCGFSHVSGSAVHQATEVPRSPFRLRATAFSNKSHW